MSPLTSQTAPLARFMAELIEDRTTAPIGESQNSGESDVPDAILRHHRLAPLAFSLGYSAFRRDYAHSAVLVTQRERTLEEMSHVLGQHQIDFCRLKGSAYAIDLYADPAERPMGDIDILVPSKQMTAAISALQSLGFSHRSSESGVAFAPTHHSITMDRSGVSIDVHRSMMQAYRSRIDLDRIWDRADKQSHRIESTDAVLLHMAHMIRSEFSLPLSSYVDLSRLLDAAPQTRAQILDRADEYRIGKGCRTAFALFDAIAKPSQPWPLRYPLPSRQQIYEGSPLGRTQQLLAKAVLVDGPQEFAGLALVTFWERSRLWRLRSGSSPFSRRR